MSSCYLIVHYHMQEDFNQISKQSLVDFLPCIVKSDKEEVLILEKWENHFRSLSVPYCIKERVTYVNNAHRRVLSLWKERKGQN